MRAIILAGGKGVRLLPYTLTIPKPLVPIKNKAVLELIIYKLVMKIDNKNNSTSYKK